MSRALLDDHLLRDLLADESGKALTRLLRTHEPATTNLFYVRLCNSVARARGGQLTGAWPTDQRRALGRALTQLTPEVEIVPLRDVAPRMGELSAIHPISALGAEAIAAAEHLAAPLCVWDGNDGIGIRTAAKAAHVRYRSLSR